ncbi:transposable element Tc1 transposase [Trichonephila clavipes]|nr:transposable element Tc1 transposase [Trichonephila clavipes]
MNHASIFGTIDGRIRDRRNAGERCLPECVIERHSALTLEIMAWGAISYHGRSNLLRIEGNLSRKRYVREVLQPEVVPFLDVCREGRGRGMTKGTELTQEGFRAANRTLVSNMRSRLQGAFAVETYFSNDRSGVAVQRVFRSHFDTPLRSRVPLD